MIHIWRPLRGGGGVGGGGVKQKWNVIGCRRVGLCECSGRPIFIFSLKKSGFAPWPDIMLIIYYWQETFLLTLTSDSEASLKWYHCIACGLNRTIGHVVNLNMTWLYFILYISFLFNFVDPHTRARCCSVVCLRFQVMQIKQVDCKISTKNIFFKKTFPNIFEQLHKQIDSEASAQPWPSASFRYKRKAKNGFLIFLKLLWGRDWLQLNEKKSMESQTRLMNWYWKQKPTWKKDLI